MPTLRKKRLLSYWRKGTPGVSEERRNRKMKMIEDKRNFVFYEIPFCAVKYFLLLIRLCLRQIHLPQRGRFVLRTACSFREANKTFPFGEGGGEADGWGYTAKIPRQNFSVGGLILLIKIRTFQGICLPFHTVCILPPKKDSSYHRTKSAWCGRSA